MSKHILSVIVKNHSGVLTRVSGLFSRRGYNIDSLSVGKTQDPQYSRMTITLNGGDEETNQVKKHLNKLYDVKKIVELKSENSVLRELVFVKVKADAEKRTLINGIVDIFRCRVVDVSTETLTLELTGDDGKISALIDVLKEYGIVEIVRGGLIAVERGKSNIGLMDQKGSLD